MSRADWSFLEHLLDEGQEYSTTVGRVWLTVLFLFRILVLGAAAESAWDDEQTEFICNTLQPGCTEVCYDRAFPISHFRYFVLQVIFVSTPTIFYFAYVAMMARKNKEKEEVKDEKQAEEGRSKNGDVVTERLNTKVTEDNVKEKEKEKSGGKGTKTDKPPTEVPKLKGRLLGAYALSILLKVLLEVGFILGLWFLYNGYFMEAQFQCTWFPCRHTVDCFVSRPTEKTIFTIYTQVIAAISVLLNLIELLHLLQLAISQRLEKRYRAEYLDYRPRAKQEPARQQAPEVQAEASEPYKAESHVELPTQGAAVHYSNPCESYGDMAIEVNWGSGENGTDLLPSYVNCMGAMRTTHSPRVHYKKQTHHTGKNTKGVHKGHSKQKHYV